jgi:hypothetical protein
MDKNILWRIRVMNFQTEASNNFTISKAEERIILAVALVPSEIDHQNDEIDAKEIEKGLASWMESGHHLKLNHTEPADHLAKVIQAFIAPENYTINNHPIKKGSLIVGLKILDEDLWEDIVAGSYRGLSVAGVSKVMEVK